MEMCTLNKRGFVLIESLLLLQVITITSVVLLQAMSLLSQEVKYTQDNTYEIQQMEEAYE